MDLLHRVESLAAHGQIVPAARLLIDAAGAGDRDAAYELALWRFSGALIRRDLVEARRLLLQAADAGHATADREAIALLASGAGADRQWQTALSRLKARAASDRDALREVRLIEAMDLDQEGEPRALPLQEQLSERPFVALVRGCLTPDEARYLIDMATPFFERAAVLEPGADRTSINPIRTADHACFPLLDETPAVHAINRRLAAISQTQAEQGEPLQVLRYQLGQEYRLHTDAFPGAAPNQRIKTVLVWLNEGYEGGETAFPSAGLKLRGETGDALIFSNVGADGRPDPDAQHAGEPVARGTKFLASKWIRAEPLDLAGPPGRPL